MEFDSLKLSIDKKVATIAFSRPEVMNAFNTQQIIDLKEATEIVKNDSGIRVLVLTGEGKGFTSGADLSENDASWKDTKDALMRGYLPSINNIISMPKIVIGSINGPAAGIGAAYAMACDLRIMSEEAFILSVFSNIALVPDGGLSWLLARNIGYSKALEFAIEAKKISSQECLQLGIANKVCSPKNLESETQKWAQSISMRSPQAVTNTKKIMRDSLEKKFIQTYEDEANTQNSIFGNDEFKEGVTAFFEKRKPVFK